ncbi:MAG: hypothetical protein ACOC0V_00290 [Oceanicaulis sp.]
MKYLADLLRPILTVVVTVFAGGFLISVFWPEADAFIQNRLPVWERLDPVIEQARAWLGIHRPEEPEPWWKFWD